MPKRGGVGERGGGREGQRGERGVDKRGYSYIDRHQKSINTPQKGPGANSLCPL